MEALQPIVDCLLRRETMLALTSSSRMALTTEEPRRIFKHRHTQTAPTTLRPSLLLEAWYLPTTDAPAESSLKDLKEELMAAGSLSHRSHGRTPIPIKTSLRRQIRFYSPPADM